MSYRHSRADEMPLTPIRYPNQYEPDELDTAAALIHTRTVPARWSPSQLYASAEVGYASPSDVEWYDPWANVPLQKHAAVPESTAFASPQYNPYLATGYTHSDRKRSSSCFSLSGQSTPGLSWRDSSCSPLSFIDDPAFPPVPHAEPMCFSAAVGSTSQLLTSSPHLSPAGQPPPFAFPGAQAYDCAAYTLAPQPAFEVPTVDEVLAHEEHWPELFLREPYAALPPLPAPAALPPAPPHTPQSLQAAAPQELPELQHPKPWRPYVPSWQTATEFDLAQFVPPQPAPPAACTADVPPCQAGPSWVLPSLGETAAVHHADGRGHGPGVAEDEEDEGGCASEDEVEELMDLEWTPEDQGAFAYAQLESPAHHPYAGGPTATRFGAATLPPMHRNVPQLLPPDSLLYQPIRFSVASNWTSADPNPYAYTHCS
ncbi:hypothetical protein PsYK624_023450 [Phanerochaete sordida]|uniref:Uncharacterized protein n=1 Tax=Phanerochaete sordida TaxID=48140 RepID=A0A9P3G232_9APHY|nr:hypothetical protein PsYK624_023450 [Phanerochaete sordida]